MKNKYAALEKEYLDTIARLSKITGWPAEQAESVVELVVRAAEKKAHAVTEKKYQDMKNAKYLATKRLLQNYRRLREAINLGTEHALKLLEDTEYQRLMEGEESLQNQRVQSVAFAAAGNRVIWSWVNTALDCLKGISDNAKTDREKRQYSLIYKRYIAPHEYPVGEIAASLRIEQAEYYRGINSALENLSILLFGLGNAEEFILCREKG
ncbi:hypothetical protein [Acutalibacter sp. JLR.KK004]|uniref:hypothetical protein n=1 Tax=Acutalibacter sp. JLR.KK004 TaxID=3112622 RepID=UPI002FEE8B08